MRRPSCAESGSHGNEDRQLAIFGQDLFVQHPRGHKDRRHREPNRQDKPAHGRFGQLTSQALARVAKDAHQDDQRHHHDVLHKQHADRCAAMARIDLAVLAEDANDQRGGAERDGGAKGHRFTPSHAKRHQHPGSGPQQEHNRKRAADDHSRSQLHQTAEGELKTEGKQQQRHSDFCDQRNFAA